MGSRVDILWARKSHPLVARAVWGHVPAMGDGHGVMGMPWQEAEELPAMLISAREQDVWHPDLPHGYPHLIGWSLENQLHTVLPAGIRSPQPGCASTTVPQPRRKVLGLPANQGWRMEKEKYQRSAMPQNITTVSPHHALGTGTC